MRRLSAFLVWAPLLGHPSRPYAQALDSFPPQLLVFESAWEENGNRVVDGRLMRPVTVEAPSRHPLLAHLVVSPATAECAWHRKLTN